LLLFIISYENKIIKFNQMNRRLVILQNTLLELTFGGNMYHWFLNLLSPKCDALSKTVIIKIEKSENYNIIHLKGITTPIYLLENISLHSIYQVIAEQFFYWHWHNYQIPQTLVRKDDIVFDCGSAEGIFPLLIHNNCKKVYAFEPLIDYQKGLKKTFSNIDNVYLVNEALGNMVGSIGFVQSGIQSSISKDISENSVAINTIDNFCNLNSCEVNYIKADIEGYEIELIKGAKESIKKFKPKIAITVYHKENNYLEIKSFLKNIVPEYNFKIKGISDLKNHPVMLHAWVE